MRDSDGMLGFRPPAYPPPPPPPPPPGPQTAHHRHHHHSPGLGVAWQALAAAAKSIFSVASCNMSARVQNKLTTDVTNCEKQAFLI